ncbi:MAG: PDZ domain-containing protein, partial [Bdellovibrionales bacterium]|nr:PDZ domain-containing protein [Bdellovibrionales bacterium]
LNTYLGRVGMELGVSEKNNLNTGLSFKVQDNRVFIDKVLLDSDAYKAGLYVGDEILAIDGIRFLPSDLKTFENLKSCERLLISRFGNISQVELHVKNSKKSTQLYLREKGEFIQANA